MKKNVSKITDLLAMAVFAVFAVCVLLVLLYGARVYGNLTRQGETRFQQRTAAQYVTTRVRQAEKLSVTDFDGCEALTIYENIDGESYITRVYCHDGFLRELFCAEDAALSPADGEKIMAADNLCFSIEDSLLKANIDGVQIALQLRGKTGGAP